MPGYFEGTNLSITELDAMPFKSTIIRTGDGTISRPYYINSALRRDGASAPLKFIPGSLDSEMKDDFMTSPPFKNIKLCNLVDGRVTAYEGEPGFTRTPSKGDVMVEIPRFICYKQPNDYFSITGSYAPDPTDRSMAVRHRPNADAPNGYEKIYVSAYTLNSGFRSLSGQNSITNKTLEEFRQGCKNRGSGYYMFDYATYCEILSLYCVDVANLNSQVFIGNGIVSGSAPQKTGGSDLILGHTGRASSSAVNPETAAVKYRHIENLWGNLYTMLDGAYRKGRNVGGSYGIRPDLYLNLNPKNPVWMQMINNNNGSIAMDGEYIMLLKSSYFDYNLSEWAYIFEGGQGNGSANGFCDWGEFKSLRNDTTKESFIVGGSYSTTNGKAGIFHIVSMAEGTKRPDVTCRLIYLPE